MPISFAMYISLPVHTYSGTNKSYFMKFYIGQFYYILPVHANFGTNIMDTLHEDLHAFLLEPRE
jgi:hypothetical protein